MEIAILWVESSLITVEINLINVDNSFICFPQSNFWKILFVNYKKYIELELKTLNE